MVKNSLNCVWDTGTGFGCRTLACTEVLPVRNISCSIFVVEFY